MKAAFAILAGLLPAMVAAVAIPAALPEADPAAMAALESAPEPRGLSDADTIKAATLGWIADTQVVSTFLDNVAAGSFRSQSAYTRAAQAAYLAEAEEWAWKNRLWRWFQNDHSCKNSNSTLEHDGTWMNTKNLLLQLTRLNWNADQEQIQDLVGQIHWGDGYAQGRCDYILPAFDTYYNASSTALGYYKPGDKSLRGLKAYRPQACLSGGGSST